MKAIQQPHVDGKRLGRPLWSRGQINPGAENRSRPRFPIVQASVHICVQSEAAAASSESCESDELGQKLLIVPNAANRCEPQQTNLVGNTGFEPVTSTV